MRDDTIPVPGAPDRAGVSGPGTRADFTPELLRTGWWTDDLLARADIPVLDIPFVSVGLAAGRPLSPAARRGAPDPRPSASTAMLLPPEPARRMEVRS